MTAYDFWLLLFATLFVLLAFPSPVRNAWEALAINALFLLSDFFRKEEELTEELFGADDESDF